MSEDISPPSNYHIERFYEKGVIGRGYFAPSIDTVKNGNNRLVVDSSLAPIDALPSMDAVYQTDEYNWRDIHMEVREEDDIGVLLESSRTKDIELEGDRVLVAYGSTKNMFRGNDNLV